MNAICRPTSLYPNTAADVCVLVHDALLICDSLFASLLTEIWGGVHVCCRECSVDSPTVVNQEFLNDTQLLQLPEHLSADPFLYSAVDTTIAEKSQEFCGI